MDPGTQTYVVVLQEKDGARLLPIWIGQPEAESIVMHMHNMKRARPFTHDLCKTLINGLGAVLRRVQTHGSAQAERGCNAGCRPRHLKSLREKITIAPNSSAATYSAA